MSIIFLLIDEINSCKAKYEFISTINCQLTHLEKDKTSNAFTRKWVICLPNATQRSFLPPCLSCQSLVRWALHLFSSRRDGRRRRLYQTAPSVSPTLILQTFVLITCPDKFNQIVGKFSCDFAWSGVFIGFFCWNWGQLAPTWHQDIKSLSSSSPSTIVDFIRIFSLRYRLTLLSWFIGQIDCPQMQYGKS